MGTHGARVSVQAIGVQAGCSRELNNWMMRGHGQDSRRMEGVGC